GKGVMARELAHAVGQYGRRHGVTLDAGLYTVADLCGRAAVAASSEDYLIPSCLLGATVSGLVSRSILNAAVVGPGDFHGCLYYEEFTPADLSCWFVDQVEEECRRQQGSAELAVLAPPTPADLARRAVESAVFLAQARQQFGVTDVNFVKPGIG